ncbi:hypothetical protein BP6252_12698 [Coleophoma cylindrospora]|uniref:Uncharacterized protein n=1 Tax=Coleophoma cylindrospora TaxID=1849047 RepID=A0A3D8QCZ4_9HELO|nr:hypothetical protein BP6252_12698 [Coleophoma cylindrospora]
MLVQHVYPGRPLRKYPLGRADFGLVHGGQAKCRGTVLGVHYCVVGVGEDVAVRKSAAVSAGSPKAAADRLP